MKKKFKAVVQKVVKDGKHGPFAVATIEDFDGSVTFSLEPTVWQEDETPEAGEIVLLLRIRKKRAGWRAKQGRYYTPSDEQTANRKEQAMKTVTALLARLKARFFGTEDENAWTNWVNFKKQEWRDLYALIASDVRPSFKERAILVLLVPLWEWVPFYWRESGSDYKYWCDRKFTKTLTPELAEYTADLVKDFYKAVMEMGEPGKHSSALYFYNQCIIDLLPLLSEEKANELFGCYQLNDPVSFSGMDDSSGYNFFRYLMSSDIDIKWKRMADAQMRQIIRNEVAGESKPRADWEQAIRCYANIVELNLYGEKLPYDVEMFASQMDFIIDNAGDEKYCLLQSYHLVKYFKLFSGEKYRELRRRITQYVILYKGEDFRIYSDELMEASQMIMKEFGETELELATILKPAIENGKEELAERRRQAEMKKGHEKGILASMR